MIIPFFLLLSLIMGFFLSIFFSKKLNIYDYPSKRKIHKKPVLCIGGFYLFFAICFSTIIYFVLKNFINFPIAYISTKFIINFLIVSFSILIFRSSR